MFARFHPSKGIDWRLKILTHNALWKIANFLNPFSNHLRIFIYLK